MTSGKSETTVMQSQVLEVSYEGVYIEGAVWEKVEVESERNKEIV